MNVISMGIQSMIAISKYAVHISLVVQVSLTCIAGFYAFFLSS